MEGTDLRTRRGIPNSEETAQGAEPQDVPHTGEKVRDFRGALRRGRRSAAAGEEEPERGGGPTATSGDRRTGGRSEESQRQQGLRTGWSSTRGRESHDFGKHGILYGAF